MKRKKNKGWKVGSHKNNALIHQEKPGDVLYCSHCFYESQYSLLGIDCFSFRQVMLWRVFSSRVRVQTLEISLRSFSLILELLETFMRAFISNLKPTDMEQFSSCAQCNLFRQVTTKPWYILLRLLVIDKQNKTNKLICDLISWRCGLRSWTLTNKILNVTNCLNKAPTCKMLCAHKNTLHISKHTLQIVSP